jgi:hypothetical protein
MTEENNKGALLFAVSVWPVCMANILKLSMKFCPHAPAKQKQALMRTSSMTVWDHLGPFSAMHVHHIQHIPVSTFNPVK